MESPRWDAEAQAHVGVVSLRREAVSPSLPRSCSVFFNTNTMSLSQPCQETLVFFFLFLFFF